MKNKGKKINKKVIIGLIPALIGDILAVFSLLYLPERVTVNVSFSGNASYMSKYIAVALPLAITMISSKGYISSLDKHEENEKTKENGQKYFVFSFVGVALLIWLIVKNI